MEELENDDRSDSSIDNLDNSNTTASSSSSGATIALLDKFRRKEKTAVDDTFFSVREMEAFAQQAETWDGRQAEREYKQEESDSEGEEGGIKDGLKRDFDLGLGFFDQDPDNDDDGEEEDDDEDLMNMDDDMENSNGKNIVFDFLLYYWGYVD